MRKTLLGFLALLLAMPSVRADILIIGDSHTAGPFGTFLHKSLAQKQPGQIIMVYGHSSSAPIHWMKNGVIKLSGGINHHMSHNGIYLTHPTLPHYSIKQDTPYLLEVLRNPVLHSIWKKKIPTVPKIDTIVIALGANDQSAVSTPHGARTKTFKKRVEILDNMLNEITARGIKCIWIGPPGSILRTDAHIQTAHDYLKEGIKSRCPFYDSRKFVARHCDKVHFNCSKAMETAKAWSKEAAEFVDENM